MIRKTADRLYNIFLGAHTRKVVEEGVIYISVAGFFIHLALILLVQWDVIHINDRLQLLQSPIAAIYTPFTFILAYEVYLLIYYLPSSISNYIAKQYEIITLIIIRRVFKDMANLEFTTDWFSSQEDLQFTYDVIATLCLFLLLFFFARLVANRHSSNDQPQSDDDLNRFIRLKQYLSTLMVPILAILAIYTFTNWIINHLSSIGELVKSFKDVNKIFFDEFFTILILVDVLLLLFSFLHTDKFHKVMRNSGFMISTILIRLSFGVDGLLNTILIVGAVLFGVLILAIHNQFEHKLDAPVTEKP